LHKVTNIFIFKEKVAIKILNKTKLDDKTQRLLLREISSMQKLHHQNIIRLYEVIHTSTRLYICMEYAPDGELFTRINDSGKIKEIEARIIFSQIISAVNHMHSNNIIHRDIKAENIFFANFFPIIVKIGDFGFSIEATMTKQLNTYCGSPPYAAPELFRDDTYLGIYVDIWALGVLLYFMVTSLMPFKAETVGKLKRVILGGEYVIPGHVSEFCQLLIRGILKSVPSDRFSIRDIMESAW
jgi:serine/threonine-protein kinase NIM1